MGSKPARAAMNHLQHELTAEQRVCIESCGCDLDLIESGTVRCLCVLEMDARDVSSIVCGALHCACPFEIPPTAEAYQFEVRRLKAELAVLRGGRA